MTENWDAIIIGAGAAGLAAARALADAKLRVIVLEARDRIGGRIFTRHTADSPLPIELGAEFIHGKPPETWKILHEAKLNAYDVPDDHWSLPSPTSKLKKSDEFWPRLERVMGKLNVVSRARDMSFNAFVEKYFAKSKDREAVKLARSYVEGFDASDADRISAYSLKQSAKDEEKIEADKLFRLACGYDRLTSWLSSGFEVRLNTIVESIRWKSGKVSIAARSMTGETLEPFVAPRVLITLPLGVLQLDEREAGAVKFDPDISGKRAAASKLVMGPVIKVVCQFREAFWEKLRPELANMVFMHGPDLPLPTWWTMLAMRAPILVGWSGGPKANALSGKSNAELTDLSVKCLSVLFKLSRRNILSQLQGCHSHDWQNDPFARGAYSYVAVGGSNAMRELAKPINDTLYFAGEATHWQGMSGTVAGAIASGQRAAKEILDNLRRRR